MTVVSGKITIATHRSDDAQKGGEGDVPHGNINHWLKDLERRLDARYEELYGRREVMAETEELDVEELLDEIEELEDAETLDADDDPTVKPAKKGRKTRSKKSGAVKTRKAKGEGGIGTNELAEAAGVDPRALRVLLRAEFPREEGGRYNWKSLNDPEAKAIIKRVRSGAVKEAQTEKLSKLKNRKKTTAKAKTTKSTRSVKGKKGKVTKTKADRARERRARQKAEAGTE